MEDATTNSAKAEEIAAENICNLEGNATLRESDDHSQRNSATVMRVFSFLFVKDFKIIVRIKADIRIQGMGQMLEELVLLHEFIVPKEGAPRRTKVRPNYI